MRQLAFQSHYYLESLKTLMYLLRLGYFYIVQNAGNIYDRIMYLMQYARLRTI